MPPCSPSPRGLRDKSPLIHPSGSACAAVLGFSSTESITGGCVFRAGRAKAAQLQEVCIFLILRLSWAGWLLHKSEQHQALPSQIHPGAAGLGWGSGTLGLCSLCLPTAVERPHRNLRAQVCSKASSKQNITKNNHQ